MFAKRNKRAEKYSLNSSGLREGEEEGGEDEKMRTKEEEEEERRRLEEEVKARGREGRVKTFLADERLLAGRRLKGKKGWADEGGRDDGEKEEEEDVSGEEGAIGTPRMTGVFGGVNLSSKGKCDSTSERYNKNG